ncbi:MAG: carboxypeptidase-like regulatory domain-containing protein [Lentimicrobium sp.]|nr:carboxypeptidase-like regulatory domain-containing protein [Lentimicrobium sp.]
MIRFLPLILSLFISFTCFSQEYVVRGRVSDSATAEPLAFVNIVINDGKQGGVSDIDGRFRLVAHEPITSLGISYVGYRKQRIIIGKEKANLQVKLVQLQTELSEVLIVAGENPAHRFIRKAVENRNINNPRNISSYSFNSYDKMIFTINADSLRHGDTMALDSADLKLLKVIETQHLFMMESVSEHKYLFPDRSHDKIIATRASGFKDPLFIFLISQMQSASFYDEFISIAGANYINPVSPNSENLYFFNLEDTLYSNQPGDSTFVISFRPRPGKNYDGMKGLLYISNKLWAIKNVIAEPARANEKFEMRIQQMYEFIDGKQWFPVQLNTEVTFNNINLNKTRPVGIGKSYRRDIVLDAEIIGKEIANIAVEITPQAGSQAEALWNQYRIDSLTLREINTYRIVDSVGKANSFDNRMKGLAAMMSGKVPLGYLDLDLNRLMRYNTYEGFYLGIGLHTSERVSRFYSVGGYVGYGFKDKDFKYGTDLLLRLQRYEDLTLRLKYAYDLEESGGTNFFDDVITVLHPENYRRFYLTRMDRSETAEAMLGFRIFRYLKAGVGIARSYKKAAFNYAYQQNEDDPAVLTSEHTFGKLIVGLKFAWGEKFIRNATQQASLGTKFPILWVQYTNSTAGFLDGQFDYNRFDAKLKFSFITRLVGKTDVQLTGGFIDNPAPYSELFNGHGSRTSSFSVYSPGAFATMRTDEFLNDRVAAIFISHNFGKLLFRSEFFEPELGFALNAGVGSLKDPWRHRYATFKTMEMGYFESGILVSNILKSAFSALGLGLFYRSGAYSFDSFEKNLTLKLTLNFNL